MVVLELFELQTVVFQALRLWACLWALVDLPIASQDLIEIFRELKSQSLIQIQEINLIFAQERRLEPETKPPDFSCCQLVPLSH